MAKNPVKKKTTKKKPEKKTSSRNKSNSIAERATGTTSNADAAASGATKKAR